MRVLRAVVLAIGMMGLAASAAACGGSSKGADEPKNPCAGAAGDTTANPCAGGDTTANPCNPCAGGDSTANPCGGGDENPCAGGDSNPCGGGDENPCGDW